MLRRYPVLLLVLILAALGLGMGKKKEKLVITFHVETDSHEGEKFSTRLPVPGESGARYFKRSPEFDHRDIAWFYPFTSTDGMTFGAVFKMNRVGTQRLETTSIENSGLYFATVIRPGGITSVSIIDRVISDGMITVWSGLSPELIDVFRENLEEYTGNPGDGPSR